MNSIRTASWTVCTLMAMAPLASWAAPSDSPVGVWKTIDDTTGAVRALVRIYEKDGKLFGEVADVFDAQAAKQVCESCKDERKNQPIIGLTIIRNIKQEGKEYAGGDILDPDTGSVYRCKMHLEQDGHRLIVRGYIGFSFIGRAQTWLRQD